MNEARLRTGDCVQYRGGGPLMHVLTASGSLCYCNWVDASGQLQRGTFEECNLTAAAPPQSEAAATG